nr:ribonuclease H-like domain, reverse transcriptase, RNA-dependent DNA polymerase [Tanacetum cinerariifolium]
MKMFDNGTKDEYAVKLSGIASKSATLGEVMSKHKLVKKFLPILPKHIVHIMAALEQVLDLKMMGFKDVAEYSNMNNDSSEGRGRGSYSRGHVYYNPALRSNVISLGQATIFGYDISIRGTNEVGRESDKKVNPHSILVMVYKTNRDSEEDKYRSDNTSISIAQLETIQVLIALAAGKGWKIHHLDIKQERYAMKILKEAGMEDCNATLCSMEPRLKLSKAEGDLEVETTQYQKMVGCLRFLLHTRLDLMYSVGVVSRYMQSPRESHARAIKQILQYLKGTTGHIFYLGTSPITWCSQKKTIVALSSYEAEFMAATAAACQAIWLRELLVEVTGLERQKVIIRVDNKSGIALSKNSVFHGRSIHIHTRYHFNLECVRRKQKSRCVNDGLAAHKVQGDEIVTWCAKVTLFDS